MKLIRFNTYDINFQDKDFPRKRHYVGWGIYLTEFFDSEQQERLYIFLLQNGEEGQFPLKNIGGLSEIQREIKESVKSVVESTKIGHRFTIPHVDTEPYMLAMVDKGGKVAAIGLNSANRFCDPVVVDDIYNITEPELNQIFNNKKFVRI